MMLQRILMDPEVPSKSILVKLQLKVGSMMMVLYFKNVEKSVLVGPLIIKLELDKEKLM
jgi:hypothetical protein